MGITSKPVVFAVLAAVVILIGTTVTVFIPLSLHAFDATGQRLHKTLHCCGTGGTRHLYA